MTAVIVHRTHNDDGVRVNSTLEFFNSIRRGQMIRVGRFGSPLIFTANWKETIMRHTNILVTQGLSDFVFVDTDNDASSWEVVTDENGHPMEVCPDTCSAIDQYIAEWKSNQNLHKVIANLRNDIQLINKALNDNAEEQRWCDTYETKIKELNETLSEETHLEGRLKDRSVRVIVTATWDVWLNVEARSQEDAEEFFEAESAEEIYLRAKDIQSCPDDINFEIGS